MFNSFVFEFLTPSLWGGHNFLISNPFSTIFNVLDAPRRGLQVVFGLYKQQTPSLASIL